MEDPIFVRPGANGVDPRQFLKTSDISQVKLLLINSEKEPESSRLP